MLKSWVNVLACKLQMPQLWAGTIAEFLIKNAKTKVTDRLPLITKVKNK